MSILYVFFGALLLWCVFFAALLLWWKKIKKKQGAGEITREEVRKMERNLVTMIVTFLSGLRLISLNMAFRHLKNMNLEN